MTIDAKWLPPPGRPGWREEPASPAWRLVVSESLYDANGELIAHLQAWDDDGPFYCNAIAPDGTHHRLGAGISVVGAKDWAERVTGYKVDRPIGV